MSNSNILIGKNAVLEALKQRLAKFSLELAEDKTRILPIGRFKGTKDDFDFLGFTFYNTRTKEGKYRLGIRTSKKKLKAKRQAMKAWLRTRLTEPVDQTMRRLASGLRGHNNYYGVNGNLEAIQKFYYYAETMLYKMFNRRSQRKSMSYDKFRRIWHYYIKPPRITVNIWYSTPRNA